MSNFPSNIETVILEILKFTADGIEIRDRLRSLYPDLWIIIQGTKFSYFISRANKSVGVFHNKFKSIKFLIYIPPYTEITPFIPEVPICNGCWTLTLIKKNPNSSCELISELYDFIKSVDYSDQTKAGELIKMKANRLEEKFWHVIIGDDFTCILPSDDIKYLLYCRAKQGKDTIDVVAFRKQGTQKTVDWKGLSQGAIYLILTFVFFLGVFGMLKCESTTDTFLCRNYKTLLYIGLAFMFSKASKSLLRKLKKS